MNTEVSRSLISDRPVIARETRSRLDGFHRRSVPHALVDLMLEDGWELERKLKTVTKLRKVKSHDVLHEDRVWAMFARLGFSALNSDRNLRIQYGKLPNESKQIDVLAIDDEVVVVVECKSTMTIRPDTFKTEVEAISGRRDGVIRALKTEFPNHKIKFVLAAQNFSVSVETRDRIEAAKIVYFDEDAIDYFHELAYHMGTAARYQLLGNLLAGTKIPNLDNKVPAIQGKMGGQSYYAFAIEPARLLKLAYVLHRSKANSQMMPTYQRIIKRSRLKQVRDFVNAGGSFPNSVIINIDTGRRLRFDKAAGSEELKSLGLLHLPQTYRAAYVIDGQHRLYGYADTEFSGRDSIPVVAFVNLPRKQQVELFMQINENQKPVPKNLRNTLYADLLWSSESLKEQNLALRLRTAQYLGEDKSSPLRGRIVIGEDKATDTRCITIESISNGLLRSSLLGTFSDKEVLSTGSFYRGSNELTFAGLHPILIYVFDQLSELAPKQWEAGKGQGGLLFMNTGVNALIRIVGDIIDHLANEGLVGRPASADSNTKTLITPYIHAISDYINGLSDEELRELRRQYGTAGPAQLWRRIQLGIRDRHPEFNPEGLDEFVANEKKEHNVGARDNVSVVEEILKSDVAASLEEYFGQSWFKHGVPKTVVVNSSALAVEKNLELKDDEEVEPWDCLYLKDYREIFMRDHETWQAIFAGAYTRPEDKTAGSSWKKHADWVTQLNKIRNKAAHGGGQVSTAEYEFTLEIRTWLEKSTVV